MISHQPILVTAWLLVLVPLFSPVHSFPTGTGTCNASAQAVISQTGQHPIALTLGFYLDFPTRYSPGLTYTIYIRNNGRNPNITYVNGFLAYATDVNGMRQGSFIPVLGESTVDMWSAVESVMATGSTLAYCGSNGSLPNSSLTHENGAPKPLGLQLQWTAPSTDVGTLTWQGMCEWSNVQFYIQILTPWQMCSLTNTTVCGPFDPTSLPSGPVTPPNPSAATPIGLVSVSESTCGSFVPVSLAVMPPGFCVSAFAVNMSRPRGLFVLGTDVLVVETGGDNGKISGVSLLRDSNKDGVIDFKTEYYRIWNQLGLSHGLAVNNGYVYASSPTTVWRVPLNTPDVTKPVDSTRVVIMVKNIPEIHHTTRTLLADSQWLYLAVGSGSNVDPDDSRSRVIRYNLTAPMPAGGWQWDGYSASAVMPFAVGLRNEVGLTFDPTGVIWGVMNADDELNRTDLGGYGIHNENPAERLDKLTEVRMSSWYGYPFCWAVQSLPPLPRGQMMSWGGGHIEYYLDGNHTDAWCQSHALPPDYSFQAHSAPLGLAYYNGSGQYAFPSNYSDTFFIAQHGSWDADPPRGYKVITIKTDGHGNLISNSDTDFFRYAGPADISSVWPHKPVDIKLGSSGELYVSSDGASDDSTGTIFVIRYMGTANTNGGSGRQGWSGVGEWGCAALGSMLVLGLSW